MKPVLLKTCASNLEADLVKLNLSRMGIGCVLINEHFTQMLPGYSGMLGGGVRVMVAENDLDRARKVLHLDKDHITCPSCGSTDFSLKTRTRWWGILSVALGVLIGNLLNDFECHNCGEEFRA